MELWLLFAYAVGSAVGMTIGAKIAYNRAVTFTVGHTVSALIASGYLRATPPGADGSQELIKFDEH